MNRREGRPEREVRTRIQPPPDALLPAIEPVRKVRVVPQAGMQLPPRVHESGRISILVIRTRCVEDARERARLGLRVPRRLVPIRLWVREVCSIEMRRNGEGRPLVSTRRQRMRHLNTFSRVHVIEHGRGRLLEARVTRCEGHPRARSHWYHGYNGPTRRPAASPCSVLDHHSLRHPQSRQNKEHAPSSVGATFRSPVHITGFFLSSSRMYTSKCLFHSFFASSVCVGTGLCQN